MVRVRAYFDRLGLGDPPPPTIDGLRRLHAAHLERVPFENLSIHLVEPIVLEPRALVADVDQTDPAGTFRIVDAGGWPARPAQAVRSARPRATGRTSVSRPERTTDPRP